MKQINTLITDIENLTKNELIKYIKDNSKLINEDNFTSEKTSQQ